MSAIASSGNIEAELVKREEVAEGTMAFHLSKPPGFEFKAGQAIDMTVLHPAETDAEGNIRAFSIASPPFAQELVIATRMRDTAFKRFLKSVPLGTRVKVEGPSGSFTLHNNAKKPAVFLAGGIGITPFVSIIRQAVHERLPHQLFLFYSNRRPEDAAFMEELKAAQASYAKNFHFIPTMTEISKSKQKWNGEVGLIDGKLLAKYVSELQGPIYYVAGPPGLVSAMRKMLTTAGVDEDDIRTEEFGGY